MIEKKRHFRHRGIQYHDVWDRHAWAESTNSLWLTSTLSLHRNIDKFHFPHRLDEGKRDAVSEMIVKSAEGAAGFDTKSMAILSFDELDPMQREYFSEHFLILHEVVDGIKGRIVMTDVSGEMALQINFADHLQLHAIELHGELEKRLEKLISIERHIEKKLPFAFSDRFGYLTSDPTICGSALIVRAYIHAPAVLLSEGGLGSFASEKLDMISLSGLQGSTTDFIGDIVVVSNRWTLGVTEEMILSSVRTEAMRLVSHEKAVMAKIGKEKDAHALDKIGRAIGVLKHCYSIDTSEALRALSMIKFGIELGWVSGMTAIEVNRLLLSCRRAHLTQMILERNSEKAQEKRLTVEEVYSERAELLRNAVSKIELQ